ncbi:serine--tRNA ligase [Candidatus Woesebacteria bacterium RIFOXYB1_FULL_33_9]|nr:MAG: serine--tRNA ligase [Candidatus Woesebacteria bacterium RIFOXYB1_FULL_33_9]
MLDIKFIRENVDLVKRVVKNKQLDISIVDSVLKIDEKKRKLIGEVEELRGLKNKYASEKNIEKGKETKLKLQELEPRLSEVEKEFLAAIYKIPNIVSSDTPIGKDESENKVIRSWGTPKEFKFTPKDHLELGTKLGIIDSELAGRVVGTRFTYLFGDAVLLQNSLYQFALEVLLKKGFIPVLPPLFINPDVYTKMARLSPETEIERYAIERDNQYLIGSAEHTLGPMHMGETLNEKALPLRYFAFTPAFRREAGSYGKDTKGILRQHQFDKLEMESFSTPEQGLVEQDFFVSIQEELMQALEIPYQVVAICTGDMGGPDFRQMDIESWMPGQGKYRETHTSDYMTDYQSRRLNTRVKTKNGVEFVHMNDATAFAMGRTIIAILENYQNEDGSINVPSVLQKWMGKSKIQTK